MTDETVTISRAEYDRLLAEIEDLRDSFDLLKAERADDGTRVPGEVVEHLVNGDHPLAAWRKYRGLSVDKLAETTGMTSGQIEAIEGGETAGAVSEVRALAQALDAPVALLIGGD